MIKTVLHIMKHQHCKDRTKCYASLNTDHMHCMSWRLLCWSPSFVNSTAVFSAKTTWTIREFYTKNKVRKKQQRKLPKLQRSSSNENQRNRQKNLISLQHAFHTVTINITITEIHTPGFICKCSSSSQITSMLQYPTLYSKTCNDYSTVF